MPKTLTRNVPRYADGVLLDLVGLLYDAAGDVDKWQVFVEATTQVFHGTAGHLLSYNPDVRQIHLNFNLFFGIAPETMEAYAEFFARRKETPMEELDLRTPVVQQYAGQAFCCSMLADRSAFEQSELYRTFLHPHGLDYTLGIHVPHEPPCYSVIGIMRSEARGPYDAEDVAALNKMAPHFHRAIRLQNQLLEIDLQKRSAMDTLNLLPVGICIVDAQGYVLFANHTAERLSQEEGGVSLHGERIWASAPKQTAEIREKIHQTVVAAEAGKLEPGCTFSLPRPPPRRPLSLTISPLWGNHLKTSLGFLQRPYAILFLNDPDTAQETHVELFQRLYGVTAAEGRVLKQLCDGKKPKEIADALDIAVKTVRMHLSKLFSKTATTNQSELIRLALASQPQARF